MKQNALFRLFVTVLVGTTVSATALATAEAGNRATSLRQSKVGRELAPSRGSTGVGNRRAGKSPRRIGKPLVARAHVRASDADIAVGAPNQKDAKDAVKPNKALAKAHWKAAGLSGAIAVGLTVAGFQLPAIGESEILGLTVGLGATGSYLASFFLVLAAADAS